jgi:hypothetical protein
MTYFALQKERKKKRRKQFHKYNIKVTKTNQPITNPTMLMNTTVDHIDASDDDDGIE